MKAYLKSHLPALVLVSMFSVFILVSVVLNIPAGWKIKDNFFQFAAEMLSFLPAMFILIGLFDVWIPKEKIEKHIGKNSSVMGAVWVIVLAMLQVGPLYGAFPVAYLLWKKGAGTRNIFIYIGAFSTMKIPLLSMEIGFLGLKFSLLRTLITLPVFIVVARIIDFYLKDKNFTVREPEK